MYNNDNQKIGESIMRGKAMKKELSDQIDTLNDQEFFDMIRAINNSKME